jgi:Tfp pilus assembly protein PilF
MPYLSGRNTLRGLIAVILFSPFIAISGCSDVITHAHQAHREGIKLYNDGDYADAAGAFRSAIRQDPCQYESHFYLGVCYDELGQHQQAFTQYRTTLDVMQQTAWGRGDRAFRDRVLQTYASAIARFDDREVELNNLAARVSGSQKAEDWLLLARVYREKGDADSAVDAYRRAAQWDIENFDIRKEYGLYLLNSLNQQRPAEYYLRQAYRLNPQDEAVIVALQRLGVMPDAAAKAQEGAGRSGITSGSPESGRTVQVPRD